MQSSESIIMTKLDTSSNTQDEQAKSLPVSVAFPLATPGFIFPPSVSDYFQFDDLLTSDEQVLKRKIRDFMEKEVAPITTKYWEKAEFPFELIPKLGDLRIAGGIIKGYGCPDLSMMANAIVVAEVSRVDASISTFIGVHSYFGMRTIALYGSEEQKHKYLPSLAKFETVACWAITEPAHGSDVGITLQTTARKVKGGWILNGNKRWIGNSTFADILVICAINTETNQVNAFILKKGAQGLQTNKIGHKIGQRILQNGDILMRDVFVPDEDRIPEINSMADIVKIMFFMRLIVSWQCIGIAMGVYDMCHRYLKERKQFGAPLAAFQINQQKLVRMLSNIQAMFLLGWRGCKLFESGKLTSGHASMSKSWTSLMARETVSMGRELLGGNGIITDFFVAKAFCDLEAVYTYEGTYDINTLITAREVTGISSLKAPQLRKQSRL